MDSVPARPRIAGGYRAALARMEPHIPVPDVNPSWWSLLGLVGSVACLYAASPGVKLALVFGVLLTDWWDGATARRHGGELAGREGYIVDVVIDRFSEGFIFLADVGHPVGRVFFVLFIFNTVSTIWGAKTGKHRILPLRAVWLGVLAWWMVA
jgi:phosphatidylglycerophosphate synthase